MNYRVGVTRKTNSKVTNWVADTESGYTYDESAAKVYSTRDEASKVARSETKGNWRGVVQQVR